MGRIPHTKRTCDGITFDSTVEYQRYLELKLLQHAGEIHDLECHPSFELQPPFKVYGKAERAIRYTADFQYIERDRVVVEEVKSAHTRTDRAYSIRRRLFIYKYRGNIEFREVVR
jgi:hypothetical protein